MLDQELSLRKKTRYRFGRRSRRFLKAWVRRDEQDAPSSCPYLQAGPLSQLCSGTGTQNRGSRDRSLWPREYGGSFLCLCVPWGAPATPQSGKERPSSGEEQTPGLPPRADVGQMASRRRKIHVAVRGRQGPRQAGHLQTQTRVPQRLGEADLSEPSGHSLSGSRRPPPASPVVGVRRPARSEPLGGWAPRAEAQSLQRTHTQ